MKKAMKEVNIAPTAKMRMLMKRMNCENNMPIPNVKTSFEDVKPPKRLLKSSRNIVEATLNAKVAIVKPV
jgi:hypothetical protein